LPCRLKRIVCTDSPATVAREVGPLPTGLSCEPRNETRGKRPAYGRVQAGQPFRLQH
jgi:hypothetical protein